MIYLIERIPTLRCGRSRLSRLNHVYIPPNTNHRPLKFYSGSTNEPSEIKWFQQDLPSLLVHEIQVPKELLKLKPNAVNKSLKSKNTARSIATPDYTYSRELLRRLYRDVEENYGYYAEMLLEKFKKNKMIIPTEEVIPLIKYLYDLGLLKPAYNVFRWHYRLFPLDAFSIKNKDLIVILYLCYRVNKFSMFDEVASKYLKRINDLNPILNMLVHVYLSLDNYPLVKQIFYQFVQNNLTTNSNKGIAQSLEYYISQLIHYKTPIHSILFAFGLWNTHNLPITIKTYSMIYSALCREGNQAEILNYSRLLKERQIFDHVQFRSNIFIRETRKSNATYFEIKSKFQNKVAAYLAEFQNLPQTEDKDSLIISFQKRVIKTMVELKCKKRDIIHINNELFKDYQDKVKYSNEMYITKLYSDQGSTSSIMSQIKYLKSNNIPFDNYYIFLFWRAFLHKYPYRYKSTSYRVSALLKSLRDHYPTGTSHQQMLHLIRSKCIDLDDKEWFKDTEQQLFKELATIIRSTFFTHQSFMETYTLEDIKRLEQSGNIQLLLSHVNKNSIDLSSSMLIKLLNYQLERLLKATPNSRIFESRAATKVDEFVDVYRSKLKGQDYAYLAFLSVKFRLFSMTEPFVNECLSLEEESGNSFVKLYNYISLMDCYFFQNDLVKINQIIDTLQTDPILLRPVFINRLHYWTKFLPFLRFPDEDSKAKFKAKWDQFNSHCKKRLNKDKKKYFISLDRGLQMLHDWCLQVYPSQKPKTDSTQDKDVTTLKDKQ
ncbi:Hypothetical protein PP7435_CHR1-1343 [Komagataella phaffii CBS 7435]|uniref:Uncharacterized protein n=2 Tax=Komagataella phaffii TaxID=460519 RepID=C4QYS1_KOMPG|nr:Hypothetical protein PAS_chr1-4_0540 [Komagataella phaffii GS115]AOA61004.1 GQ67_01607T0 [Komagataella phaffii]CAH2447220.1 Hypothetical protein BQ9382_C1-7030 [Komagataella phaffii CBS 7435]AOA66614.1 GQ68_01623T0 [Komagataella phaffii GS115]CAY68395.1 Hypothetical protein PAS_chr1-4_0540 [Komagataella phaffii GS115]CCA37461.1 Hypothetical protein PP7435_CHR1-1343 [Komagataella phaffii CBS 7435]